MVRRHSEAMPLPEIDRRVRCSECEEKGSSVQVVVVTW